MIAILLGLTTAHAISPEKEVKKATEKLVAADGLRDFAAIQAAATGLSADAQSLLWLDAGKRFARSTEGCTGIYLDAPDGRDDGLRMVDALRLAVAAGGAAASDAASRLKRDARLLADCGSRLAALVRRGEPGRREEPKDALLRSLAQLELAEELGGPTLATSSWLAILYSHQGRAPAATAAVERLAGLEDDPAVEPATLAEAYRVTAAVSSTPEALVNTGLQHLESLKTSRVKPRSAFDTSERTEDPIVAQVDAARAALQPASPTP